MIRATTRVPLGMDANTFRVISDGFLNGSAICGCRRPATLTTCAPSSIEMQNNASTPTRNWCRFLDNLAELTRGQAPPNAIFYRETKSSRSD